jgi:hypothetical protein
MKTIPYVWLIDRRACVATYARVKRLWRWGGPRAERHGRLVVAGLVTRITVDYLGTNLTLSLWRPSDRWRLSDSPTPPEWCR